MKEIVYIETTIVSYLVARPSGDLVLSAHQQVTREWWENERRNYHCISSQEVVREAMLGDTGMAQARIKMLEEVQIVGVTAEVDPVVRQALKRDRQRRERHRLPDRVRVRVRI